jgi:hypothetical protein
LILFPAADGPLKLPNIGFDNENQFTSMITLQNKNSVPAKARLEMKAPIGKKNLQTYIKTLQAKQNFIDNETRQAISEQKKEPQSIGLTEEDDPRDVVDLAEEHNDLQDQFLFQLKNLEQYYNVANLWLEENREQGRFYSDNGSFEGNNGSIGDDEFYTADGFADTADKAKFNC